MAVERVAIITGANRGLGLEISRQLARTHHHVVLTSRDAGKGRAACRTLREAGWAVTYRRLDVTSARSVKAFADFVTADLKRADILVNNAGVMLDARGTR